jgi:hypothetical protein
MNSELRLLERFEAHLAEWQRDIVRRVYNRDAHLVAVAFTIARPGE